MAIPIAAAVAGGAGIGAYLNGKYHVAKDLKAIHAAKRGQWKFENALRSNTVNVHKSFLAHVARQPEAECIWTPSCSYTWLQTSQLVNRYGRWFLAQGIGRNDIIAFYLQNSAEFMFAWLGLLAIGAAPAMINYNLTGKALVHCIGVSEAVLILGDEELADRLTENDGIRALGIPTVVLTEQLKNEIEALEGGKLPEEVTEGIDENSMLALRYTSGTTGFPKAVRTPISKTYLLTFGKFSEMGLRSGPSRDRWYISMPMCHGVAGSTVIGCMILGIALCVGRFSVTKFWQEIRDSKATAFLYVGEVCRYLLAAPPSPLDRKHHVRMMYGNGLRPDVWKLFRDRFGIAEIDELFGSTEGVVTMVNQAKGDFLANAVGHHGAIMRRQYRDVYIPVEIDYESGEVVRNSETGFARRNPYNRGGEIIVAVPSKAAFLGYYQNPGATEERFLYDVFKKGDLYYRSGDALKRDGDGRWFFLDRLGDTFRWKGENVSTAEVSEVLGRFPGVVDANVYGVEIPRHDGRAGCAALLLSGESEKIFDPQALLRHTQRDLPRFAVPVFLRIVKEPSMSHTHKQTKTGLREEGVNPAKVKQDQLYVLKDDTYVPFGHDDWNSLLRGISRL